MSSISNFNNNTYLYNNNTWRPKNSYVADGQHTLPMKYTREPYFTKDDAIKSIKVLEDARNYEENQEKHIDMVNVHGPQEAVLDAIFALDGVEIPPQLIEYFEELRNLHDLGVWVDMMRGAGGSIKKHKKKKRRRPTKKRPIKKIRKKRTIKRRR